MFKILTLNNISVRGLECFPRDRYEVASEIMRPDAILVRSHNMHHMEIAETVKAVGRAGTGMNNIPVEKLSVQGIAVFSAPGANANAVAELVIAGMLLASRSICQAWNFVRSLTGDDATLHAEVEACKSQFRGFELPGRLLGVIGLGAIGVRVANTALALGMKVIGYDPDITVQRAWQLSSEVEQASSIEHLLVRADFVSLHVPLNNYTRHMINANRLGLMKNGVVLLNFARDGIIEEDAVSSVLNVGKLHAYVCDFPTWRLKDHPRVIALPHIGASTKEAEDNCAVMVAEQVREFLENGNVRNSVNFPEMVIPHNGGYRLAIVNANVPNMLGQISTTLARAGLNIADMLNRSRNELAYTLVDVDSEIPPKAVQEIAAIEGVRCVRLI
jgi:Phosphoglycerate dehydrogenase and related dehydrogenases